MMNQLSGIAIFVENMGCDTLALIFPILAVSIQFGYLETRHIVHKNKRGETIENRLAIFSSTSIRDQYFPEIMIFWSLGIVRLYNFQP